MSDSESKRIELKFPFRNGESGIVERNLISSIPSLVRPYPDRIVHSVYWDSAGQRDYYDNLSGTTPRQKLRLRWYNSRHNVSAIEIKEKHGRISSKHTFRVPDSTNVGRVLDNPLSVCKAGMGVKTRHALMQRPIPLLYVRYRRKYFATIRNIRFTIDTDMRFADPSHRGLEVSSPVDGLLELKFPLEAEEEAASYIQRIGLQGYRHSKYMIGINCLYY